MASQNTLRALAHRRNWNLFFTLMALVATLWAPAVSWLINQGLQNWIASHPAENVILAYTQPDSQADEIRAFIETTQFHPQVLNIQWHPKEAILKRLSDDPQVAQAIRLIDANPFHDTLMITPKTEDLKTLDAFVNALRSQPLFLDVRYDTLWLEGWKKLSSWLNGLSLTLMLTLGSGALVIMAHTMGLMVQQRQKEITVKQFVGATAWQIHLPFLKTALFIGLFSGLMVCALLLPSSYFLSQQTALIDLAGLTFNFSPLYALAIVSFSTLTSCVGSWLAVHSYLRKDHF
jgi:cell division protein FtsX